MNKKIAVIGLLSSMVLLGTSAYASISEVKSDGYIDITGDGAAANSMVTVEIIDAKTDLSSGDVWSDFSDNGNITAFMGATQADANGKYELGVFIKNSGKYLVRVGNSGFTTVKEDELKFIFESKMKECINALKTAADNDDEDTIKGLLTNNRFDLGIFAEVGNDAEKDKAAKALKDYVKNNSDLITEESVGTICEKACVLSIIENSDFGGFGKYADGFGMGDLKVSKFYKAYFAEKLTQMMKKDNPKTIEEYDKALEKNTILCLISLNDSAEELKECLELYASEIGVDKSKITSSMCKALMGESNINTYEDIVEFANKFSSSSTGGSSGGGSYGGITSGGSSSIGEKAFSEEYIPSTTITDGISVFKDMDGYEWAKESVEGLFGKGIIAGIGDGLFAPNDNVLREEFVKMIVKSFELSVIGSKLPFSDVAEGEWYTEFVECAYHSGIVNGYSDTVFGIGDAVSREDLAVMIARAIEICDYKLNGDNKTAAEFADSDDISEYALSAVNKLASAGIISGDENSRFNPKQSATRAETAKMLWMTIQKCEK
ncbi:MAG: S-layer homology domain-containing protein [Monoglobaceae bacterium]